MKRDLPIFDGHNDVLLKLHMAGGVSAARSFLTGCSGAIDLPRARTGGLGGAFFAIYVPSATDMGAKFEDMTRASYDLPLPPPVDWADAMAVVQSQIAILSELERLGALTICRSVAEIRETLATDKMAAIFHMEGCEAIDADCLALELFHRAGLRSLGPVWSRPTVFGHGVPFRYPSDPDTGPGLTEAGKHLIRRCNEMRIMVDLSHLNEAGFWDVADLSEHPLVATHSNAHAICPHSRNLTDAQLAAIRDSDGMVGVNFAVAFLRADGRMLADVALDQMLRHLDHLITHLGEDRVGFGSDYDGAIVPQDLTSCASLGKLRQVMKRHGYNDALMEKLCSENWMRVLERTWGG